MNRLASLALAALLSTFAFASVGCAAGDTSSSEDDVQQSAASSSELGDKGKVVVGMPKGDVREGLDLGARKMDAVTNENVQADPTLKLDSDRARFNDQAAIANEAKPDLGLVTQEQFPRAVYKKY